MFGRRFKPSLWATLAALVGVTAGLALGQWQLGRAQHKLELAKLIEQRASEPPIHIGAEELAASDVEHRAVEARGHFEVRGMVLLDNRVRGGVAGYEVVMPLRLTGTEVCVLVNRGWVPGTGDRSRLPQVRTPPGEVLVRGIAVVPGRNLYELSSQAIEGVVWQNLTIERYRTHMNYPIQPVLIRQTNDLADGLARQWTTSDREINVHRSYALQWFSLSVLIALMYFFLSLRRVTTDD